jgi:EAL domain-containing protein (putative c-di-GMP-specific phosphodiesterase class I)/GGDEF domain-containing protein
LPKPESRVLLVETDDLLADAVTDALGSEGSDVHVERIETATALVSQLGEATWDMVVTNHRLNGFGAHEVLALVREFGGDLPVIVVAGEVGGEIAAELMRAGASDLVSANNLARLPVALRRERDEAGQRRGRRVADQRAWRLAFRDPVTELPNQHGMVDRIARALLVPTAPTSVIWLELVDIADIRNTIGARQLDVLLRNAVFRFSGIVRTPATLAHLSTGTFAVCLPGHDVASALPVAASLVRSLANPVCDGSMRARFHAHAGVAAAPADGDSADTLLRRAAVAAAVAKRRAQPVFRYDSECDPFTQERLAVVTDLWGAAERGELRLEFLPAVDLPARNTVSAEALVRWRRPGKGLLFPCDFIPIAERSGSIREITRWVIQEAVAACATWQSDGIPLGVAVNLSTAGIHEPGIVEIIEQALQVHGLPPTSLTVELTESGVMRDPKVATQVLGSLHALGVRSAIDDFGTGYSCLAHLRNLPVHALKIDRSFLQGGLADPQDRNIVQSTVNLAHQLGLSVVAEGVESEATLELVSSLGCHRAQGHHIARPLHRRSLGPWLSTSGFPALA